MTACAASTETKREGTAEQICKTWKPIYPSRQDKLTKGTAEQIAGNNVASEQWCGKREVEKESQRVARSDR